MKIIVVGGNCTNKGAQALLFITMYELKKRYPDAELYFDSQDNFTENDKYVFKHVDRRALRNALAIKSGKVKAGQGYSRVLKDGIWAIRDRRWYAVMAEFGYMKLLDEVSLIVDISGYNLASKFSNEHNNLFLDIIEYAMDCNIKTVIMPQSFGPFDYKTDKERMIHRISEVLNRSELVYAREPGGLASLTEIGVNGAILSDDLVIQSSNFELASICRKPAATEPLNTIKKEAVAIIPNEKVFVNCNDKEGLYQTYRDIINKALRDENSIYLLYHSNEDLAICRKIKAFFDTNENVHIIEKELEFYEYEKLVKQFKYIIASRYHSIILAFRQAVPCIGIGWAEKYEYLFGRAGEERFVHTVNEEGLSANVIRDMDFMNINFSKESGTIKENVALIQENTCFDGLFNVIDNL